MCMTYYDAYIHDVNTHPHTYVHTYTTYILLLTYKQVVYAKSYINL